MQSVGRHSLDSWLLWPGPKDWNQGADRPAQGRAAALGFLVVPESRLFPRVASRGLCFGSGL